MNTWIWVDCDEAGKPRVDEEGFIGAAETATLFETIEGSSVIPYVPASEVDELRKELERREEQRCAAKDATIAALGEEVDRLRSEVERADSAAYSAMASDVASGRRIAELERDKAILLAKLASAQGKAK